MLVARLEIWPYGDPEQAYPIGTVKIINDGTGDDACANYDVIAEPRSAEMPCQETLQAQVMYFHRARGAWTLLWQAIQAICEVERQQP